ncbi:NapC/NirT family cytochrome c, partial [bacterium]|nr:NapC/NirT family cytochrome c [bacterium]
MLLLLFAPATTLLMVGSEKSTSAIGCLSCHEGIAPFTEGQMMAQIKALGEKHGDPEGCITCHGGTPSATKKEEAHRDVPHGLRLSGGPQRFYPNPGNALVASYTCGQCHPGYAQRVQRSLITTDTEYIHRNLCLAAIERRNTFEGPTKRFGRYDLEDKNGLIPDVGSPSYESFMASLTRNPELFAQQVHRPPTFAENKLADIESPECHDCHGPRPLRQTVEDEHGSGCSACHVPYRSGGTYLGLDSTIDKAQPGKLLVHRLQGTANTRVTLPAQHEDETYRGMLIDNCFTCHHDVREEMLNPIGAVMSHYGSRHKDGMGGALLCQDCHTTIDMHGDGNIPLTSHAQMEVRCEDCHGTVELAPWELPLGYRRTTRKSESAAP